MDRRCSRRTDSDASSPAPGRPTASCRLPLEVDITLIIERYQGGRQDGTWRVLAAHIAPRARWASGRVGVRVERLEPAGRRAQRLRDLGRRGGVTARDAHPPVRADQEEHAGALGTQRRHVPVLALRLGPRVDVAGVEQDPAAVAVARTPPQAMRVALGVRAPETALVVMVAAHTVPYRGGRAELERPACEIRHSWATSRPTRRAGHRIGSPAM